MSLTNRTANVKKTRPQLLQRRALSHSPGDRTRGFAPPTCQTANGRKCMSLSPSTNPSKNSIELPQESISAPATVKRQPLANQEQELKLSRVSLVDSKKEVNLPQCVITKLLRGIATKRREFLKVKKQMIAQQNVFLEQYAQLRELEARAGAGLPAGESAGDVRVLSVSGWPAHDLLMLVRDDVNLPRGEVYGVIGPQMLQQLNSQLSAIPQEVLNMGEEIMARRLELLHLLRGRQRNERSSYTSNLEWKSKNAEFDMETERLRKMMEATVKNLEAKLNYCLEVAKTPWLDRDTLIKKIDRLQKELAISQSKLEDLKKEEDPATRKEDDINHLTPEYSAVLEELQKEKAAREALKEVVSAAESMLRVARARIASLERQLKETRAELECTRRKHKDLEQLYRHRETSYDARSRKLLEVSKTGEAAIEALSRQRDALELRVRELREQADAAEREAEAREAEQKARAESLQAKVAEQIKDKRSAEAKIEDLENKLKELTEQYMTLSERSSKLVEMEQQRCLDYLPPKEPEPTDKETELWKELQVTRAALSRAEEELRQSRADKNNLLNTLSRIAQEGPENKMADELLQREQRIITLQKMIQELKDNEKIMEQSMTQYENQLASLRLEVRRLRNYDIYVKDVPQQDLQTELLDLCMQVETLTRERSALVSAAASRALMLERHERAAELFARVTRTRRELAAYLEGRSDVPQTLEKGARLEVSRSLSSICASAMETWTALRGERARVLRLEGAVLAQSLQLEREGCVRTQLERRRAVLEREIIRVQATANADPIYPPIHSNVLIS